MKILLCSYFKFPDGCAGAIRHEKFAQMLKSLGHDVVVVGIGKCNYFKMDIYKNIEYTSLRYDTLGYLGKIRTRLKYWNNLRNIIEEYGPDCIIMDDLRPWVTIQLKQYSKTRDILLIHDSVEWYSKQQFILGHFSPTFINKNIINKYLIDKNCRVIAISQFLMRHFETKSIECVNIPIVVSNEDLVSDKLLENEINITYAGQAGKKDYLDVIISAMTRLSKEELKKVRLHIFGCSEYQMIKNGIPKKYIDMLRSSLVIHGRVPRTEVLKVLLKSDYTILIRSEVQRYAKAGFPTKVVESLSHSTPVIANITSDLGQYLVDGYNSLVVPESSVDALLNVLKRAISMPLVQREIMCKNAYETALSKFHYKNFLDQLNYIIS